MEGQRVGKERKREKERRISLGVSVSRSTGKRTDSSVFSREDIRGRRSAVEQDPGDVWPVARKHGATRLARRA